MFLLSERTPLPIPPNRLCNAFPSVRFWERLYRNEAFTSDDFRLPSSPILTRTGTPRQNHSCSCPKYSNQDKEPNHSRGTPCSNHMSHRPFLLLIGELPLSEREIYHAPRQQ